jgi:hypothetical protein
MARLLIRRLRIVPALFVLALLAGCQQETISTYRVPRVEQSSPRLLGAIAPAGDDVWFLKLVGPAPAIVEREREFDRFVHSLRFTNDPKAPLTWTTPDGWQAVAEGPAKGLGAQTRFATFRVGPEALKLTISRLGREAGDILSNVNRWRKNDLGLPPLSDAGLSGVTRTMDVAGHTVTLVDMTGGGPATPVAPPPFVPEQAGHEKLVYDVPAGWQAQPPGQMRLAAFRVTVGDKSVEVTISSLPGAAGGWVANVNRWRGQVGLSEATAADIEKDAKMLDSAAGRVAYADLTGPKGRMLVGTILHGGTSWFVKVTGSAEVVDAQQAAFETFVKSLRFEAGAK